MKTAGWRGSGRKTDPLWKLQARRNNSANANKGYSMGGLPRARPRKAPSMPKLKFMDEPEAK